MKKFAIILVSSLLLAGTAFGSTHKSYTFHYKNGAKSHFVVTQKAPTKEDAFKLAARECFKKLTNNKYPGDEKGLEIIDICANPKI